MSSGPGAWERLCVLIATGFHISYIPVRLVGLLRGAPAEWASRGGAAGGATWTGAGFAGTALGLAAVGLLPTSPAAQAAALAAAVAVAVLASHVAERALGRHDDPRIVVDEVVGYWVTVAWLPRTAAVLLVGFALFRVLDSVKLPPYRWLDRLPGGAGIVADDVGAGLVANLMLRWVVA